MSYLFLMFLLLSPVFASPSGLERVHVKNLDFEYVYPQGSGTFEKLAFGVSILDDKQIYPLEVYRRDTSFDLLSPFIDFQWLNPMAYVHNMRKASSEKFNLKIDRGEHFLKGEWLKFTPEKNGEFFLRNFNLNCQGSSGETDVVARLKNDCFNQMEASVASMELPVTLLKEIGDELPDDYTETEDDIPANDFFFQSNKGAFNSYVRVKFVIRAYLRFWGQMHFENEGKTLAIRVDRIKYGILPVTTLVMNQLRQRVNHPHVTINPPWIRITTP